MPHFTRLALLAGAMMAAVPAAAAPNLVQNGGFEVTTLTGSAEFGASYIYPNAVTNWTSASTSAFNLYFFLPEATGPDADTRFGEAGQFLAPSFGGASPDGGNFVALDGDTNFNGALTQSISGLTVGAKYVVSFSWAATQFANRTGATLERLEVGFGSSTASTGDVVNPNQSFQGWFSESFTFTANNTTEVLSFLSIGSPNGLPPVALLDGVSVTAVPEPASWALMLVGFGLVGAATRRRKPSAVLN